MSLRLFTGEILNTPSPLEIDMNTCDHNCIYCYAQCLDRPKYYNIKSVVSTLRSSINGKKLIHATLRNNYPILLCNRTDPFAPINEKVIVPTIDILLSNGKYIEYATKGGRLINDVLKLHDQHNKKAVWYFTITTTDEKISSKIEPNAPSPKERISIIKDILSAGHKVIIGINPLLDTWMPKDNLIEFANEMSNVGVSGFWLAALHYGKNMRNEYSKKAINIALEYGHHSFGKRQQDKARQIYTQSCVEQMVEKYSVHCSMMPYEDKLFDIYDTVYPVTFPMKTSFINNMIRGKVDQMCYFDDYYIATINGKNKELFETDFTSADIEQFLMISGFRISKQFDRTKTTLKDLLKFLWNINDRMNKMPKDHILFLKCVDGNKPAVDGDGNRILYFSTENIKYNRAGKYVFDISAGIRTVVGKEVIL